ncbi:discoidin domain-containing protein [Elusimicrobiota bacterium]
MKTIKYILLSLHIVFLTCSGSKAQQDIFHIPDLRQQGEWVTAYKETFDDNSLSNNWLPLKGPALENLSETSGTFAGWEIKDNMLTGESPEVIALLLKGKFVGDIEVIIDLPHTILHRQWCIAINGRNLDDSYCLRIERTRIILTKQGTDNIIKSVNFSRWPEIQNDETKKTKIRILKEANKITIFMNGKEIINYIDLLPLLSSEFHNIYIACMSSIINIENLEIRLKQYDDPDPVVKKIIRDFNDGHLMVFLDNYNKLKDMIHKKYLPSMQLRTLQAAYDVGNYDLLIHAPKHFPKLPYALTSFMNYVGLVKKGEMFNIPSQKTTGWIVNPIIHKNANLLLMSQLNHSIQQNDIFRKEEYTELLMQQDNLEPETKHILLINQAKELAEKGNRTESYRIMEKLINNIAPAHDTFPEAILVWSDMARQFNDEVTYDKLMKLTAKNTENVMGCRSWQYLKKSEWLLAENKKEEGLLWLNKVIDEFPNELDPWLWAHWVKAKMSAADGTIEEWKPHYKDIAMKYNFYKKQSISLLSIIRKKETIEEMKIRQENIRRKTGIKSIKVSSQEEGLDDPYALIDDSLDTRWGSEHNAERQWILFEFQETKRINGLKVFWELAAARSYDIMVSLDNKTWKKAASENNGLKGHTRLFLLNHEKVKYLKIQMNARTTPWGYSIWEVVWF